MKKFLAAAALSLAGLAASGAQAQAVAQAVLVWQPTAYTYVYLGGAWNAQQCSQTAALYGYSHYYFGWGQAGGVMVTNACFGVQGAGGGGQGNLGGQRFDVYPNWGVDLRTCAEDIEWEVQGVRCRPSGNLIDCRSTRRVAARDLERVSCVSRAYATN